MNGIIKKKIYTFLKRCEGTKQNKEFFREVYLKGMKINELRITFGSSCQALSQRIDSIKDRVVENMDWKQFNIWDINYELRNDECMLYKKMITDVYQVKYSPLLKIFIPKESEGTQELYWIKSIIQEIDEKVGDIYTLRIDLGEIEKKWENKLSIDKVLSITGKFMVREVIIYNMDFYKKAIKDATLSIYEIMYFNKKPIHKDKIYDQLIMKSKIFGDDIHISFGRFKNILASRKDMFIALGGSYYKINPDFTFGRKTIWQSLNQ